MRSILVTGASGFIGRYVVDALHERGARVRCLDREPTREAGPDIETIDGDIMRPGSLTSAVTGVDAVIHLAAHMRGDADELLSVALEGTGNVIEAMAACGANKLVLIGTYNIYDWPNIGPKHDETSPILNDDGYLLEQDVYTIAKTRQELLARQLCKKHGIHLTVMRASAVWGRENQYLPNFGQKVGPVYGIFGPGRQMQLTHVANCANALAAGALDDRANGQTFNIIDDYAITAWQYLGEYLRQRKQFGIRVPLPRSLCRLLISCVYALASCVGMKDRLPSLMRPQRFDSRFPTAMSSNAKLKNELGWSPPHDLAECLKMTYE